MLFHRPTKREKTSCNFFFPNFLFFGNLFKIPSKPKKEFPWPKISKLDIEGDGKLIVNVEKMVLFFVFFFQNPTNLYFLKKLRKDYLYLKISRIKTKK